MATCPSHTSAPDVTATVAPFRAWRSSQLIVAREPKQVTITKLGIILTLVLPYKLNQASISLYRCQRDVAVCKSVSTINKKKVIQTRTGPDFCPMIWLYTVLYRHF